MNRRVDGKCKKGHVIAEVGLTAPSGDKSSQCLACKREARSRYSKRMHVKKPAFGWDTTPRICQCDRPWHGGEDECGKCGRPLVPVAA